MKRFEFEWLEQRHLLATLTVDSTTDTVDANPGDAICADSGGGCSLRAAIEEANALTGADNIEFNMGGGGASNDCNCLATSVDHRIAHHRWLDTAERYQDHHRRVSHEFHRYDRQSFKRQRTAQTAGNCQR